MKNTSDVSEELAYNCRIKLQISEFGISCNTLQYYNEFTDRVTAVKI
jgi:hypothetical protein